MQAAVAARTTGSNTPAAPHDSDLPSDFDQFVGLKGTDEIAELALLMAGDKSSYMTGQCVVVDGGVLLSSI